ncbi:MAG TPA: alternative ribosome rescue aminoacyl-tRNA hydrolase ArfB [Gemmatimonadales bacterium]|nr:alternative ribosome rescue aminoacyl-tRNA hydrolase ArfB [Gemmatimonadales bacterium]
MAAAPIPSDHAVPIRPGIAVPRQELTYRATRSGGPGGQHVNKTSSRVELTWSVATTTALGPELRARALQRLANRLDGDGVLRLVSDRTRSQLLNKEDVTERFAEVLRAALTLPKARKATKVSKAVKARRLDAKKRHGAKKADRRRRDHD